MASGKPILAALTGDAVDVVIGAGAGLVCPPGNPEALAEMVHRFYVMPEVELQALARRGIETARSKYSRDVLVGAIEDVLRNSAGHQSAQE